MSAEAYFVDEKWEHINYTETPFLKGEYEDCIFENCNLQTLNLNNVSFINCRFIHCNLSSVSLIKTSFKNVFFDNCKLVGALFCDCNTFLFEVKLENCIANFASFYNLNLKKIAFKNTTFIEADFTETNLQEALFEKCDLKNAKFENTNLEKANLSTAYNYTINPTINKIAKATFSLPEAIGLLSAFNINITSH